MFPLPRGSSTAMDKAAVILEKATDYYFDFINFELHVQLEQFYIIERHRFVTPKTTYLT